MLVNHQLIIFSYWSRVSMCFHSFFSPACLCCHNEFDLLAFDWWNFNSRTNSLWFAATFACYNFSLIINCKNEITQQTHSWNELTGILNTETTNKLANNSSNQKNVKSGVSALSSTSSSFGTAASSAKFESHSNGIDEGLKAQVLAEEEAAMNQYKVFFNSFPSQFLAQLLTLQISFNSQRSARQRMAQTRSLHRLPRLQATL